MSSLPINTDVIVSNAREIQYSIKNRGEKGRKLLPQKFIVLIVKANDTKSPISNDDICINIILHFR